MNLNLLVVPTLLVYPSWVQTAVAASSGNDSVHNVYHVLNINTSNIPSDEYGPPTSLTPPSYWNAGSVTTHV